MNILWITNILLPEVTSILTGAGNLKDSGGWMVGAANSLIKNKTIQLHVASVSALVSELKKIEGNNITYYVIPISGGNTHYNKRYEEFWKIIENDVKPDVVHIHGTEFTHGLSYIRACGNEKVVVSIQGLVSVIAKYYNLGLSTKDIISNITFRDILRGTLYKSAKLFKKRGVYEVELLKSVKHVIGRTSWDKAQVWAINPDLKYYSCNETLRKEFYEGHKWSQDKCVSHSIFLSQATYPIKGLHQVLRAIPLVRQHYPDVTIRIAGADITKNSTLKEKILFSGYSKIIRSIIKKLDLEDYVSFTSNLDAVQMREEYLRCNVFACPSSIENSPNSLGEAQILGVPCVASYAGGIPDMMKGNEDNLYRFDDSKLLAYKICRVFEHSVSLVDMSEVARNRHDPESNAYSLVTIYETINKG